MMRNELRVALVYDIELAERYEIALVASFRIVEGNFMFCIERGICYINNRTYLLRKTRALSVKPETDAAGLELQYLRKCGSASRPSQGLEK